MSLLFTAASELKLRNDDCAESGSFFIMARSLIEAENCAIEPLSDIWIRVILRWQACLFACDALLLFIIAVIAGVVGNKPGSGYNAMPLRFQKAQGVSAQITTDTRYGPMRKILCGVSCTLPQCLRLSLPLWFTLDTKKENRTQCW